MCSPGRYCCWAEGDHRAQIVCSCWRAVAVFPGEADTRRQRAQQYPWAQWWRHGVPIQTSLLPHRLQLAEWVTGRSTDQVGSWNQGVLPCWLLRVLQVTLLLVCCWCLLFCQTPSVYIETETNHLLSLDYFWLLHRISLCLLWRQSFSTGLASNLLCLSVRGRHLMRPLMVRHWVSIR